MIRKVSPASVQTTQPVHLFDNTKPYTHFPQRQIKTVVTNAGPHLSKT